MCLSEASTDFNTIWYLCLAKIVLEKISQILWYNLEFPEYSVHPELQEQIVLVNWWPFSVGIFDFFISMKKTFCNAHMYIMWQRKRQLNKT